MMKYFCLIASLLIVTGVLIPREATAARAELWGPDKKHAESAFYFATRDNWHEAVLHAARAQNMLLRDYITWLGLKDWGSNFDFAAFNAFLSRHPNWPDESRLVLRAEDRLFEDPSTTPLQTQLHWFQRHPPISGKGKMVYAEALRASRTGSAIAIAELIREAWRDGDYGESYEKELMQRYRKILRVEDHIARVDRLIWEGKPTAAARMMFAIPKSQQALFEARIRLALNKPGVSNAVARVPAKLQNDAGLIYERMKWRERKRIYDGVEEMLFAAPATVPYPEKWWKSRHYAIREALDKKQYSKAVKLLKNHGQTGGVGLADALWLQGWIHLTKLNQPEAALGYFTQLEKNVSYPVSLSRGGYWSGRAALALGRKEEAYQHFSRASAHNTTFYGQLAAEYIQTNPSITLPSIARLTTQQLHDFESDPRVRVVYMLSELGMHNEAYAFIERVMEDADNQSRALLTAELGKAIGQRHFGVKVSKEALKQHIVLPTTNYPYYRLRFKPAIEPALMWAITRQESLFNPSVQSSAGARGLMQLMPGTAREVAGKAGLRYSPSQLDDASYNLQLGSNYLGMLIEQFDGSYILAIAAYNAGPSRIRQWLSDYGHPGTDPQKAINWIETIPYSETRNYVQRVLENLQVYRAIVSPQGQHHIQLRNDLTR